VLNEVIKVGLKPIGLFTYTKRYQNILFLSLSLQNEDTVRRGPSVSWEEDPHQKPEQAGILILVFQLLEL
jgi:hypothetical protein